jgi:ATP-binding cassette subfamily F protein 3
MDMLDVQANALQHLLRLAPNATEQALRNYLAQFGFVGERVNECIAPFSGGEKARLALALVVYKRPNLLILDEPSNHLDVQTRDALSAALAEYEGSLLLVSHDRHLLRSTVDQFWLVAHAAVEPFDGDLDDYRQKISSFKPARATSNDAAAANGVDRRQQRREQAQARQQLAQVTKPLQASLKKLEDKLQAISQRLAQLDLQLADPDFYQNADSQARQRILLEHGQLSNDQQTLELECLSIMEQIETLEKSMAQASNDSDN